MPPTRKYGRGKKASDKFLTMTEEEKNIYLEQQRLLAEEIQKKKEDFLQHFIQEKITKEEKFGRFNLFKLNEQWRNIMRAAKSKELKQDIEILSQTFERIMDHKGNMVSSLIQTLEGSEGQFMMALSSHHQNMDILISLQNDRMETLKSEYSMELEAITHEFSLEKQFMCKQIGKQYSDLEDILMAFDWKIKEDEAEARIHFLNNYEECQNKNLENKQILHIKLTNKVQELWSEYQRALKSYKDTTDRKRDHYHNLRKKDEKSIADIEKRMIRLNRLVKQISVTRACLKQNAQDFDESYRQLKGERDRTLLNLQHLKGRITYLRDIQREHLTKISLESHDALKECKRLANKAEQLLYLAEHSRKLETEEEKVTPFYCSSLTPEEEEAAKLTQQGEDWVKQMHRYDHLEIFWKRFNKVQLDRLALEKERTQLVEENQKLKSCLKQYLDDISVNEEVLAPQNTMIVGNGQTNVNCVPAKPYGLLKRRGQWGPLKILPDRPWIRESKPPHLVLSSIDSMMSLY